MGHPLNIVMCEPLTWDSATKVGSHHYAEQLAAMGHRVFWISHDVHLPSLLRNPGCTPSRAVQRVGVHHDILSWHPLVPLPTEPKTDARKTHPEKEDSHRAPVAAAPKAESRSESEVVKQLRDELAHSSNLREKLAARIKADTTTLNSSRDELKELKYRVERYRRVDIMTKNQLELVTDKLLTLGRQYYDAVSELAAAKGEVVPPKPRALREAEDAAAQQALAEAEAAAHHHSDDRSGAEAPTRRKEQPLVTLNSVDISDLDDPTPEITEEITEDTEAIEAIEAIETIEAPVVNEVNEVNETEPADAGVSANG